MKGALQWDIRPLRRRGGISRVDEAELIEFDKTFPYKEKRVTESQKRFMPNSPINRNAGIKDIAYE